VTLFDPRNPKHRAAVERHAEKSLAACADLGLPCNPADERTLAMVKLLNQMLAVKRKRRAAK
jgi:hypothetical protein